MDACELSQRLSEQCAHVAQHLLPNGTKSGHQWVCGSVTGEKGSSLSVCLHGPNTGKWSDFATGQSGDLLDLWAAVFNVSLSDAYREAKNWLGITSPGKVLKTTPTIPNYPKALLEGTTPFEMASMTTSGYLTNSRKLTQATLKAFQIQVMGDDKVCYPSYLPDGTLARWKAIGISRDANGKHPMYSSKGCPPALFGWQALSCQARSVTLCEGEIDCLTLHQAGVPALSVPNGCGNLQWIDYEWERLEVFDDIVIAMDADAPGQKATGEIIKRLGKHRCRIADWNLLGVKDPNDALQNGHQLEDIKQVIDKAKGNDPDTLKPASDYLDEVLYRLEHKDEMQGLGLPWPTLSERFRVRPSELTILTGMNGSGKSQLLGQTMLHLMNQGERVCIASMEIRPVVTLERMLKQAMATENPTRQYTQAAMEWLHEKLWLFTVTGNAKVENMLEVFQYAHRRYGVTQFVVDSLMKCGLSEDDWNGQKQLVEKLCDFRMETNAHVWLVAHPRKAESETMMPTKLDVKGTSSITDLADNVLSLWRNPRKREAVNAFSEDLDNPNDPDAVLTVGKQRDGGWEGKCYLWFDAMATQFKDEAKLNPKRYVNYSTQAG